MEGTTIAVIVWTGSAQSRRQVTTLTVGSNTNGHTFITTINGKSYSTIAASQTTTEIATAILALLQASTEGEFTELEFTSSVAVITATGPEDGAPFTISCSGTGTYAASTTVSPVSPHDAGNALNYSSGSLPANGTDTLVWEGTDISVKYGLTALQALCLNFERRPSFTGSIGLPDINSNGYREYRTTHLKGNGPNYKWFEGSDSAGQFRIEFGNGLTPTWTHASGGAGGGTLPLGSEAVELKSFPSNLTINMNGGSLALAPLAGQTGGAATIRAVNSTVRIGSGVSNITTISFVNVAGEIRCGFTSMTIDGSSDVTVLGSGVAGCNTIQGGVLHWNGNGNVGNVIIASGGTLDVTGAPGPVVTGVITMGAGAVLDDSRDRLTRPWVYQRSNASAEEVVVRTGPGGTVTEAA